MTKREELCKFVLKAYWGDQIEQVAGDRNGETPSLFYLNDCGWFMGVTAIGTWEDAWKERGMSDAVREACFTNDVDVFIGVSKTVVASIVAILDGEDLSLEVR